MSLGDGTYEEKKTKNNEEENKKVANYSNSFDLSCCFRRIFSCLSQRSSFKRGDGNNYKTGKEITNSLGKMGNYC